MLLRGGIWGGGEGVKEGGFRLPISSLVRREEKGKEEFGGWGLRLGKRGWRAGSEVGCPVTRALV